MNQLAIANPEESTIDIDFICRQLRIAQETENYQIRAESIFRIGKHISFLELFEGEASDLSEEQIEVIINAANLLLDTEQVSD